MMIQTQSRVTVILKCAHDHQKKKKKTSQTLPAPTPPLPIPASPAKANEQKKVLKFDILRKFQGEDICSVYDTHRSH